VPLISQLLFKISSFCRCRIINGPDQTPYLERYHLLKLPFNYQVYLHRFVASDPGRGLHNHPWNSALSLVLSGDYEEIRMADRHSDHALQKRRVGAFRFNWINGTVFHRINLINNKEVWTLFIHGPKARSWGFLQKRQRAYAFHDHDQLLPQESNPLWWKTADKPLDFPAMRQPVNYIQTKCEQSRQSAA
jgi:hypothetical protein